MEQELKDTGIYTSLEKASDGGWRDHSEGKIGRFYTNFGHEKENYNINLSILGADTDLNGNGVTPVELLHVDRASVFTWPDNTTNKVFMITEQEITLQKMTRYICKSLCEKIIPKYF